MTQETTPATAQPLHPSKPNFAKLAPGIRTISRSSLNVRVIVRADGSRAPAPPIDPVVAAEAQRRFMICKACGHSLQGGFACDLYADCCLGRFRSVVGNHCPGSQW